MGIYEKGGRMKDLKQCLTCGEIKVGNPTPDGDEICPKCWGDCMDYEPNLDKLFNNPMAQISELEKEAHQLKVKKELI